MFESISYFFAYEYASVGVRNQFSLFKIMLNHTQGHLK